jgi:hypothetical protein
LKNFCLKHRTILLVLLVVGLVGAVSAATYNYMFSVHLYYSLIDGTPIGQQNASTGAFTTVTASQGFTGNLTGTASAAPWAGITSKPYPVNGQVWNYTGQSGQPTSLWGTNDGQNMAVWNPSNFRVSYAATSGAITGFAPVAFSGLCSIPTSGSCSSTYTFNLGYTNTNYTAVCTLIAPVGYPHILGVTKISSTTIQLAVATGTNNQSSGSAAGAECLFKGW